MNRKEIELKEEIEYLKEIIDRTNKDYVDLLNKNDNLQEDYLELLKIVDEVEKEKNYYINEIKRINNEIENQGKINIIKESKIRELEKDNNRFIQDNFKALSKIKSLEDEIKTLKYSKSYIEEENNKFRRYIEYLMKKS